MTMPEQPENKPRQIGINEAMGRIWYGDDYEKIREQGLNVEPITIEDTGHKPGEYLAYAVSTVLFLVLLFAAFCGCLALWNAVS
jgi:hypothetical protein